MATRPCKGAQREFPNRIDGGGSCTYCEKHGAYSCEKDIFNNR